MTLYSPVLRLGALHGDLAGLLRFCSRELDFEDAVVELCPHARAVGGERESDLAHEATRFPTGSRPRERHAVLLDLDLEFLGLRSGQLRAENRSGVVAPDFDRRELEPRVDRETACECAPVHGVCPPVNDGRGPGKQSRCHGFTPLQTALDAPSRTIPCHSGGRQAKMTPIPISADLDAARRTVQPGSVET